MPDIKEDAHRIMDDYVTLRLFMLLSGAGIAAIGGMFGFLWSEIAVNRELISVIPAQVEIAVAENSKFHIEQRIRVWDRTAGLEEDIIRIDRDQARLTGRIEGLIKELDRVINRLDEVNKK